MYYCCRRRLDVRKHILQNVARYIINQLNVLFIIYFVVVSVLLTKNNFTKIYIIDDNDQIYKKMSQTSNFFQYFISIQITSKYKTVLITN